MPDVDFHLPDAAWSGGHLLLADENAVGKVRRRLMSASVASKTLQCPASMAASRLLPNIEDPFGAREIGTSAHAVLEDFYNLPPEKRTKDAIVRLVQEHATQTWSVEKLERPSKAALTANDQNRQVWIEKVTAYATGIFTVENPAEVNVHRTEWELIVDLAKGIGGSAEGVPSIVYIDRTDLGPNGEWLIRDYKFADNPKKLAKPDPRYGDDYGDQQRLYVLAVEEETGVRPAGAKLLYPVLGGERPIDISDDALRATATGYKAAWDLMNASADRQMFETRPSALCPWCPLANSCPVAMVGVSRARDPERRQASIDKQLTAAAMQPSAVQLGIPVLRPGAAPADARTGVAPGVQVPRQPIEPVGDDLFPVTVPIEPNMPAQEPIPAEVPGVGEFVAEHPEAAQTPPAPRMWETTEQTTGGTVSQNIQIRAEGPAYEETVEGNLNLNSFAAMAVSGLVAEAFEHLSEQGQQVSGTALAKFSDVLAGLALRAQYATTGQVSFQRGAQTRIRGLLRAILKRRPAPFGQPAAAWAEWLARTERFLIVAITESMNLYERRPVQNDSHLYFASDVAAN